MTHNEPGGHSKAIGAILIALGIVLGIISTRVKAEGLWLTMAVKSYHMDRSAGYNEKNYGVGLEYQFNPDISVVAGEYKNSFFNKSTYYGVLYTPFVAGPVKVGILAGEISGYILKDPRAYGPIAVPTIVWEGERFGANLVVVPPMGNGTGVFGLQLKVRF